MTQMLMVKSHIVALWCFVQIHSFIMSFLFNVTIYHYAMFRELKGDESSSMLLNHLNVCRTQTWRRERRKTWASQQKIWKFSCRSGRPILNHIAWRICCLWMPRIWPSQLVSTCEWGCHGHMPWVLLVEGRTAFRVLLIYHDLPRPDGVGHPL